LALLNRLVDDEVFRQQFEKNPAQAMSKLGIPESQIATLRAKCLTPRILAPNSELTAARERLAGDRDTSMLNLVVPDARF
jgi:putative modified peptide